MEIDELQKQFTILSKRQTELETTIQKNQAKHELYAKQLHDDFGISESEIESELVKLNSEKDALWKNLSSNMLKFEEYLTKIENKLNNP
jgi:hypothetical protein